MTNLKTTTGFGYFVDESGQVHSKLVCAAGTEFDLLDGFVFYEVDTLPELDAIEVYQDPAEIQHREREQKIGAKVRAKAIAELIKDGELPEGYE